VRKILYVIFEYRDAAASLPEFNVMAVNKLFRLFDRLSIVGAFKLDRIYEMTI
jgi:hypothetical protein